jgi:hypothetical protein
MAKVEVIDDEYVLRLSRRERFFGLHQEPRAPRDALFSVTRVADPWNRQTLRGVRAPGTAIPFIVLLGTMRFKGGKDFTAIYRRKPVDIYEFSSGEFKRWIVSCE